MPNLEFDMPLFDGDLQSASGIPDGTQKLADRISTADGLVIVSPEYNHGVPGLQKCHRLAVAYQTFSHYRETMFWRPRPLVLLVEPEV